MSERNDHLSPAAPAERKELIDALGTLLDLIQLTRLLDKAKLSENDMRDFIWAKNVHSRASGAAAPQPPAELRASSDGPIVDQARRIIISMGLDHGCIDDAEGCVYSPSGCRCVQKVATALAAAAASERERAAKIAEQKAARLGDDPGPSKRAKRTAWSATGITCHEIAAAIRSQR